MPLCLASNLGNDPSSPDKAALIEAKVLEGICEFVRPLEKLTPFIELVLFLLDLG